VENLTKQTYDRAVPVHATPAAKGEATSTAIPFSIIHANISYESGMTSVARASKRSPPFRGFWGGRTSGRGCQRRRWGALHRGPR